MDKTETQKMRIDVLKFMVYDKYRMILNKICLEKL